ncbi:hypothetical protein [Paenibacillus lemnae]|uniref:CN hydrolase domain-containing protein n=1 Tax=Paenibacillus lemnae TaxID=1330551 RepID=A0A848MBV9_PAELE|nr:hypothetical protein [Paenibacillus lemnae]NMO98185.1 hypothetical protein [Paenibacillus lemnae]
MNILIAQPLLEQELKQLEHELQNHPEVDVFIFPEGYINDNFELACNLAKQYSKIVISGYKRPKDRALIIDREGRALLDRAKYDDSILVEIDEKKIGLMLCDEIVIQGMNHIKPAKIHYIVHPIGVGMFSEAQFQEWTEEARKIAKQYNTMVIGTSHANGTYRDSKVSIPIAYCLDENGKDVFISKNDTRTKILTFETKQVITV